MQHYKWLIIITILASFIRLYRLNTLTLFGDEIDVGNQAYSLLTTGRDYRGHLLPSYLQSFSESRAPLYIYTTIPSVAIFGRNELGVRLPAAIFGIISIIGFYFLTRLITRSDAVPTLSALILSITPWHVHYSRTAFEVTLLLSLLIWASHLFIRRHHLLSIILFALTTYTYNTANIITPLLLIFLHLSTKTTIKSSVTNLILFLAICTPLLIQITNGRASNRFGLISIFHNPQTINQIVDNRTSYATSNPSVERVFHNKVLSYIDIFIDNYSQAFSPQFLSGRGDPNPRHQVPNTSLITIYLLPFAIYGLAKTFTNDRFFLFWLLSAPIASALTIDGGQHATRLFIIIPPIIFFITQGLFHSPKWIRLGTVILVSFSFVRYLHQYYVHFPKENFISWQYGYKQLYQTPLPENALIYVSNTNYDSLNQFIFYQNISPQYTQSPEFSDSQTTGFGLTNRIQFVNSWPSTDVIQHIKETAISGNTYFLLQLRDIPGDWNLSDNPIPGFDTIKTVKLPNQQIFGQIIQKT